MSEQSMVLMTAEQLRALVKDAVREALNNQPGADGYLDTEGAAVFIGATVRAVQHAVARGSLVPDHRGSRGNGLKGNRFSRETLKAFIHQRQSRQAG